MSAKAVMVTAALLLSMVAAAVVFIRAERSHPRADAVAGGASATPQWRAPQFEFADQLGRPVSSSTLHGQPYIASFLFTTCKTLCPLLGAKLVMLQRKLTQPSLRFVSFSVDPANDTQAALAQWHDRFNATEARWLLARTSPESLAHIADGFGVALEKGTSAQDPIIHSSAFLLVDAQGMVVSAFDSNDDDALKRLETAVETMLGDGPRLAEVTNGAELVHSVGCLGCHLDASLAPPLQGVGREVLLETGAKAIVDRKYLEESILSPAAKRVHGFVVNMPAYGKRLSAAQVEAVVDFIASLPVTTSVTEQALIVEDPVCHMKVRVVSSTPRAQNDGGTEYFCSPTCRDRFLNRL